MNMDKLLSYRLCYYRACKKSIINEGCIYCPKHMCKAAGCYNFAGEHWLSLATNLCLYHDLESIRYYNHNNYDLTQNRKCLIKGCQSVFYAIYGAYCNSHICMSCRLAVRLNDGILCGNCRCTYSDSSGLRCKNVGVLRGINNTCRQHECKYLHCFKRVNNSGENCDVHAKKIASYNVFDCYDYYKILPRDINNIIYCYIYGTNRRLIGQVIRKTTEKRRVRFVRISVPQVICSSSIYYETIQQNRWLYTHTRPKTTYIYDDKVLVAHGNVIVDDVIKITFPEGIQMPYIGTEIYTLL